MTQAEKIADLFASLLKDSLEPHEWELMRKRNKVQTNPTTCHSHDFCDANMVMLDAWEVVMERAFIPDVGEIAPPDVALWNEAWSIAKTKELTA